MADLIADFKQLRLYGMAACFAEGLEQGQPTMTMATPLLTQLVQAEATDRATRSVSYQMHVARFPVHRDLAGFDFESREGRPPKIVSFATTAFTGAGRKHRAGRRHRAPARRIWPPPSASRP